MFDKWRKYSYAAQKHQRNRLAHVALWILAIFILYSFISSFIIYSIVLENDTMQPGALPQDRFLVSKLGIGTLGNSHPSVLARGRLVVVDQKHLTSSNPLIIAADSLVRFFTAQRFTLPGQNPERSLKRLIGFPGDEISMNEYVLRIKPRGEAYALTEFELANRPYDLTIPALPELWSASLPLSGSMDPLILLDDQCFLVSDDRSDTNDSRTWGATPLKSITGIVLFRYWPPSRIGKP
ncbi:signal peptidase I [Treponema sp.]